MERRQGSRTQEDEQDYFVLVHENDLGGCAINGDGATYYPKMWTWMVQHLGIRSMVDVGCGAGFAVEYFRDDLKIRALGVEGCKAAIDKGLLSLEKEEVVWHDYKKGPFVPQEQFDLCWTCEFVEHVEEKYVPNFLATFQRSRFLALTYAAPGQGGHHHVNERDEAYWVDIVTKAGFTFEPIITQQLRALAIEDGKKHSPFYPSHFISRGLFFKRN